MKHFTWMLLVLTLFSCDVFDKDETVPGYVVVKSANLITNELTEGANTSNIVDATIFIDGDFIGTYEMPATAAALKNGNVRVQVAAGIKNNGISSDRQIYPFYDFYETNVELLPDGRVALEDDSVLTFRYFDGLTFFIDDFESLGTDLIPGNDNTATITQTDVEEEVLSGNQSLKVELTPENDVFTAYADWDLSNVPVGNNMYLEVDFKGDQFMEIGIYIPEINQRVFVAGILPQDEWTKIYFDLRTAISQLIFNYSDIQIYLHSNLSNTDGSKEIFVDNLKFIHP